MSERETHPPEEGYDAGPERRRDEDAQRYPGHDDPDEAREAVGLDDAGRDDGPDPE